MHKILLLLISLACLQSLRSQKTDDVLFFANGSIIRGTLTEQNDSVIKIMTCCGSIFAYPAREVLRVTREKKVHNEASIPPTGYLNFTSFGVLIGSPDDQKKAPFSALMEHNYRLNKYFAPGLFLGFEQLNENVIPLGINMKFLSPVGRTGLFASFGGGYSVSLEKPDEVGMKKATGGLMAGLETGIMIPVSRGSALTLAIGYRYNKLHYRLNDYWRGDYERNRTFNRFVIRFGISVF
jgi:hypothetical protein